MSKEIHRQAEGVAPWINLLLQVGGLDFGQPAHRAQAETLSASWLAELAGIGKS